MLAPLRSVWSTNASTYGYRRIAALLNRERLKTGLSRLNHKRVYRLMLQNGLLLQRYTGKPPGRAHEGKIITIRPNLRWTSDGLEIACWNGQVVRVAFSLDTCDREVMSWRASSAGISGEMIRDLDAGERRASLRIVQSCRPRCNGSRTTAAVTALTRRSSLQTDSAWCHALPRCAVLSPNRQWPKRS